VKCVGSSVGWHTNNPLNPFSSATSSHFVWGWVILIHCDEEKL